MKSILYVHNGVNIGGVERSLLALLGGIDRRRYKLVMAAPSRSAFATAVRDIGVPVIDCRFFSLSHLVKVPQTYSQLSQAVYSKQIDLVHSHTRHTHLPAAYAAKKSRVPVIWHARFMPNAGRPDVQRLFSRLPDKIICNSEAVRKRFAGLKNFETKTEVILSGVDMYMFSSDISCRGAVRKRLQLADDDFVVGCFDRLDPVKNHEMILLAFQQFLQKAPGAVLLIVGQALEYEERYDVLREKSVDMGLTGNVRFEGFVEDVCSMMQACDVVLHASRSEGCSRVVCEAQMLGIPVVASDVGGNPEVVLDGRTGFLFASNNVEVCAYKLLLMYDNQEGREEMGHRARQWAMQKLSLTEQVKATQRVYQSLLSE